MTKRLLLVGSIGLLAVSSFLWLLLPGLTRRVALADEDDGTYITPRDPASVQEGPVAVEAEGPVISTAESRAQYASERAAALAQQQPEVTDFLGIILPPNPSPPGTRDPALQTVSLPAVSTTPGLNFIGLGLEGLNDNSNNETNYTPPDTNSATGTGTTPGQVVMNVNLFWGVYNKSTAAVLQGPTELANFFPSTSACAGGTVSGVTWNLADPVVKFDQLANRWVLTYLSYEYAPTLFHNSYYCMAVSETPDATGSFYAYAFDVGNIFSSSCTSTSGCLDDYDKFGVWPYAYFTSWNYFQQTSEAFEGVGGCAIPSAAVQSGSSATAQCFITNSNTDSLLPSDLDGGAGVPGSTQLPPNCSSTSCTNYYIGSLNGSNSFELWKYNYNATTPSSSTFTQGTSVTVDAYTEAGTTVKQPVTKNELPTLGDRLLFRNAYRYFENRNNHSWESIVVSHSVQTSATCNVGARWYEVRSTSPGSGTFLNYQDGTFQPDSSCRFMPSVAMDMKGDIALGYSLSSAAIYPSTAYTGRTPKDARGVMESEYSVVTGTSYESDQSGSAYDRWGDYSSMEVDPSDDCTMWNSQEYIIEAGSGHNEFNWSTRLNSFNFTPNCPANPH